MLVPDGLNVLDVDNLAESPGVYDLLDSGVVRGVAKHCRASQIDLTHIFGLGSQRVPCPIPNTAGVGDASTSFIILTQSAMVVAIGFSHRIW